MLIQSLAEQNAQVARAVEVLRQRQRRLTVAAGIPGRGIAGVAGVGAAAIVPVHAARLERVSNAGLHSARPHCYLLIAASAYESCAFCSYRGFAKIVARTHRQVLKACLVLLEEQLHRTRGAVTLLADDDLGPRWNRRSLL